MTVTVNTKLDNYSFHGEPVSSGTDSAVTRCSFESAPFFTLAEAMAQLASRHFKTTCGPGRQTFLLKVKNLAPWTGEAVLDGVYELKALLLAKSGAAGLYRVSADRPPEGTAVSGEFYIASVGQEEFIHK